MLMNPAMGDTFKCENSFVGSPAMRILFKQEIFYRKMKNSPTVSFSIQGLKIRNKYKKRLCRLVVPRLLCCNVYRRILIYFFFNGPVRGLFPSNLIAIAHQDAPCSPPPPEPRHPFAPGHPLAMSGLSLDKWIEQIRECEPLRRGILGGGGIHGKNNNICMR